MPFCKNQVVPIAINGYCLFIIIRRIDCSTEYFNSFPGLSMAIEWITLNFYNALGGKRNSIFWCFFSVSSWFFEVILGTWKRLNCGGMRAIDELFSFLVGNGFFLRSDWNPTPKRTDLYMQKQNYLKRPNELSFSSSRLKDYDEYECDSIENTQSSIRFRVYVRC